MTTDLPDFLRNQPRQKRSIDKYESIMVSARHLLAEVGYSDATINDIAGLAGVSVGAVYHFFPDKETIAKTITYEYTQSALGEYQAIMQSLQSGNPVVDVIKQLVRAAARLQVRHAAYYAISETWNPSDQSSLTHQTRFALNHQFKIVLEENGYRVKEGDLSLMLDFALESMRHFLHRAPKGNPERENYIIELEHMMVAYITARLSFE